MTLSGPITDVITQDKTARWHDARLGRFTASVFSDIVCARGKPTEAMLKRCASVAAERLTGMEAYSAQTKAMEWGMDLEQNAFDMLSEEWAPLEGATFVPYGEIAGCTPDGYANIDGILSTLDIKCPFNSANYLQWCGIGDGPDDLKAYSKEYYWQIMSQAAFCGLTHCSLVFFDPRMPVGKKWKARTYELTSEIGETIIASLMAAEAEAQRFMALMQAA